MDKRAHTHTWMHSTHTNLLFVYFIVCVSFVAYLYAVHVFLFANKKYENKIETNALNDLKMILITTRLIDQNVKFQAFFFKLFIFKIFKF